jgi:hypothetical protein
VGKGPNFDCYIDDIYVYDSQQDFPQSGAADAIPDLFPRRAQPSINEAQSLLNTAGGLLRL